VMRGGEIEQIGSPQEIYNQPANPFVAGFVGAANVLRGHVWEGHVHFGRSAVAGAYHLPDGVDAQAYVRPHDVAVRFEPGPLSFPVQVQRRTDLGWMSKLVLELADGQTFVAQLPNEELLGVVAGREVFADLRNAKVFAIEAVPPPSEELVPV
jgi:sulfate transport system ATP-binding protein